MRKWMFAFLVAATLAAILLCGPGALAADTESGLQVKVIDLGYLQPLMFYQAAGQKYVQLDWTASTSAGVSSYRIFRAPNACPSTGALSGTVGIGSVSLTTFNDTTAVAGTTYCYTVHAVNTIGDESSDSNYAQAVLPLPPSPPSGLSATPKKAP